MATIFLYIFYLLTNFYSVFMLQTGNTFGWFTNHGGELSIYRCEENGGDFCLKHSQRTTKYMGPKASLSHSCLESGRRFEVLAKIKLMDDNLNFYFSCFLLLFCFFRFLENIRRRRIERNTTWGSYNYPSGHFNE